MLLAKKKEGLELEVSEFRTVILEPYRLSYEGPIYLFILLLQKAL